MSGGGKRGAKPLTSRDWLFGSRPRRLVLRFVLTNKPGDDGWTKAALAKQANVHPKGGIDEHVRGLVALRLLRERAGRYWPADPTPELATRLMPVLDELDELPDRRIRTSSSSRAGK